MHQCCSAICRDGLRIARVQKALGPAGAWWLRDRVVGQLPIMLGHFVARAEIRGEKVLLHLQGPDGELSPAHY